MWLMLPSMNETSVKPTTVVNSKIIHEVDNRSYFANEVVLCVGCYWREGAFRPLGRSVWRDSKSIVNLRIATNVSLTTN